MMERHKNARQPQGINHPPRLTYPGEMDSSSGMLILLFISFIDRLAIHLTPQTNLANMDSY